MSYADEYIKRSMRVNRVSAGEAVKTANKVASSHSRIKAILQGFSDDPDVLKRQIAIKRISEIIQKTYSTAKDESERLADRLVQLEADWQVSVISDYTNAVVNLVPIEEAVQISKTTPYQGKLFSQWYKDAGLKSPNRVYGIIESGYVQGKTIPQITNEVMAYANKSIPEIKTLVRSNLLHASSIAREQVVGANDDLVEGKYWNSVLDVRTTANICGVRDQAEYDKDNNPVGHSYPWGPGPGQIHFNCRSIQIPKLIGVEVAVKRPAVGAGKEYQRGDKTTNRGTVRKPRRGDDKFKYEQKAAGTDYEKWLRTQKTDFVADALGSKEKAKAFKSGESLDSLTQNPLGTPLTIDQL